MAEREMSEMPVETKLAIAIRLAELIEQIKDPETLGGLRMIFSALVKDLSYPKVH